MKKLLFIFFAVLASQISFAQGTQFKSLVTKAEYQSMDELEKRLTDYMDAAVSSLKGLKLNGSKNYSKHEATITISSNPKDKLSNSIAVGESDGPPPINNAQSCTICNVGGAYICFRRIRTILQNGQPLIITAVEVSGDCVQVSWN
jgi:hypothetical protein